MKTIKTKIVNYLSHEAHCFLLEAEGEIVNMQKTYPELCRSLNSGAALDLKVLSLS